MTTTMEQVMESMTCDLDRCKPGEPATMEALSVGEVVWQGDLGLMVVDAPPPKYVRVDTPVDADRQLVPGNTEGSKHCLSSMEGVELWRPVGWGAENMLSGPCFRTTATVTVEHPKHGNVHVPAGMTVLCGYQREWDAERARERRNAD